MMSQVSGKIYTLTQRLSLGHGSDSFEKRVRKSYLDIATNAIEFGVSPRGVQCLSVGNNCNISSVLMAYG